MKKCQTCHLDNSDNMRFCVECGSPLPDAPFVINIGGNPPSPPPGGQPNFGQFGGGQQQQQQQYHQQQNPFPNNFSSVPPPPSTSSSSRSSKKTFLVIGGIFALFLLVAAAGAAIVGYNMLLKDEVVQNQTPTPTPNNNNNNSASPTPSKSPTASKTPTPTVTPKQTPANNSGATAELGRVWVDYNVTEGGEKGMVIHVKFTTRKMKGVDSYLAVYFEKDNGEKLYTNNKQYRSKDGQVAVYKSLKPAYEDTVYEDAEVFIPYEEFSLDSGKYNLKADIDVIFENGDMIQHLTYHDFQYTEP